MELSEQTKNARMQNWRSMRFRQWRLGAGSVVDWPKTYLRSPRLKVKKCVKRISLCAQARDGVNFDHVRFMCAPRPDPSNKPRSMVNVYQHLCHSFLCEFWVAWRFSCATIRVVSCSGAGEGLSGKSCRSTPLVVRTGFQFDEAGADATPADDSALSAETRVDCGRYPLRVRIRHFFSRSPFSLTVIARHPRFGL